jgi:hyperosmotically inducible periplasmic protein
MDRSCRDRIRRPALYEVSEAVKGCRRTGPLPGAAAIWGAPPGYLNRRNTVAEMAKVILRVEGCRCERCGHEWVPRRGAKPPKVCPRCKSPYWDTPRRSPKLTSAEQSRAAAVRQYQLNQRDRSKAEVTADQQKENRSDRELTRDIRRAIVKDKSLSTDAHNVKVVAANGMVTLKGPVRSDDEKQAIEAKAAEVAGQDKVKSELHVTADDGKKPSPKQYK